MHPKCLFLPCPQDTALKEAAKLCYPGYSHSLLVGWACVGVMPSSPCSLGQHQEDPEQRRQPTIRELWCLTLCIQEVSVLGLEQTMVPCQGAHNSCIHPTQVLGGSKGHQRASFSGYHSFKRQCVFGKHIRCLNRMAQASAG